MAVQATFHLLSQVPSGSPAEAIDISEWSTAIDFLNTLTPPPDPTYLRAGGGGDGQADDELDCV